MNGETGCAFATNSHNRILLASAADLRASMLSLHSGFRTSEIDCSYQRVGWRGRNLAERDLVKRTENERGRRVFEIRQDGRSRLFYRSLLGHIGLRRQGDRTIGAV